MFYAFCNFFKVPQINNKVNHISNNVQIKVKGFYELLNNFQGYSFGKGIYRLHRFENIEKWNELLFDIFPKFKNKIQCFGYDWLGRQFTIDITRIIDGEPQILMFEPGTGEVLEIPCNFIQFHNDEIVNYNESCLASEFFNCWMNINKINLDAKECVAYKIPLFLGGQDTVDNLEQSDMEVYWEICGRLIQKTKNLPYGTKINIIGISE